MNCINSRHNQFMSCIDSILDLYLDYWIHPDHSKYSDPCIFFSASRVVKNVAAVLKWAKNTDGRFTICSPLTVHVLHTKYVVQAAIFELIIHKGTLAKIETVSPVHLSLNDMLLIKIKQQPLKFLRLTTLASLGLMGKLFEQETKISNL